MSLMALDGPNPRIRFNGVPLFDFGNHVTPVDFVRSPHNTIANVAAEKANPTFNLEALIDHLDSEVASGKPLSTAKLTNAARELSAYTNHPAATPAQKAQISHLLMLLDELHAQAQTKGSAIAGTYTPTPPPSGSVDLGYSTHRIFGTGPGTIYVATPMGNFTGTPTAVMNDIEGGINAWLTSNSYAGSGNTNNAEKILNSQLNTSDPASRINAYVGFLDTIVSSGYYLNTYSPPSNNPLKQIGKDISAAAKDVSKVVQVVAKAVVTVAKDVEHVVAMVSAAPARLAALELIRSDALGIAKSLAAAWQQDSGKVSGFWSGLGGNPNDLKDAIIKGSGVSLSGQYMGATALAEAAVPIVNAIMDFLRAMGIPIPAVVQSKVDGWITKASATLTGTAMAAGKITTILAPPGAKAGIITKKPFPVAPVLIISGLGLAGLIYFAMND